MGIISYFLKNPERHQPSKAFFKIPWQGALYLIASIGVHAHFPSYVRTVLETWVNMFVVYSRDVQGFLPCLVGSNHYLARVRPIFSDMFQGRLRFQGPRGRPSLLLTCNRNPKCLEHLLRSTQGLSILCWVRHGLQIGNFSHAVFGIVRQPFTGGCNHERTPPQITVVSISLPTLHPRIYLNTSTAFTMSPALLWELYKYWVL